MITLAPLVTFFLLLLFPLLPFEFNCLLFSLRLNFLEFFFLLRLDDSELLSFLLEQESLLFDLLLQARFNIFDPFCADFVLEFLTEFHLLFRVHLDGGQFIFLVIWVLLHAVGVSEGVVTDGAGAWLVELLLLLLNKFRVLGDVNFKFLLG